MPHDFSLYYSDATQLLAYLLGCHTTLKLFLNLNRDTSPAPAFFSLAAIAMQAIEMLRSCCLQPCCLPLLLRLLLLYQIPCPLLRFQCYGYIGLSALIVYYCRRHHCCHHRHRRLVPPLLCLNPFPFNEGCQFHVQVWARL